MATERVFWFYRVLSLNDKGFMVLSEAPSAADAALWQQAALCVATQRARWCEGSAEYDGRVVVIGVDPVADGGRGAAAVAVAVDPQTRGAPVRARELPLRVVAKAWPAVLRRASASPIGLFAGMIAASADTPAARALRAWCREDGAAEERYTELRAAMAAHGAGAPPPCLPCGSVWCAWCKDGEVVVAGRAYGGDPEGLRLPDLAFTVEPSVLSVLPNDGQDADAIRARLDAAFGPRWHPPGAGAERADEEEDEVVGAAEPVVDCHECLDRVCHAHARTVEVAVPAPLRLWRGPEARALGDCVRVAADLNRERARPDE